jgi:hypothetical protein
VDGVTLNGATATLVIGGPMNGFTGLTAWQKVYVGSTAGSVTQTRPYAIFGAGQKMIAEMGFATATDTVFVRPLPIAYQNRQAFDDNDTLTITHHADEVGYIRKVEALFTEPSAISGASYASSNQDSEVALEGATGSGGTVTITASGSTNRIGDTTGVERWQSQSFLVVNAGILSQFTFELDPNAGSPTGNLTWEICSDNAGDPGTVLATGTHTPTANATNTVTVTGANRIFLTATTYWLVLKAAAQSSGVGYVWQASAASSYADGVSKYSADSGSSWTANAGDCQMAVTTLALTTGEKLTQTFNLAATATISHVGLYLRKFGSPTGTITVRIETISAGNPTGTLAHANATITLDEADLTTALAETLVTFEDFSLASGDYAIVLDTDRASSTSNYVTWGSDGSTPGYAGGEMKTYAAAAWSAASKDAIFTVYYPNPQPVGVDWWSSSFADVVNRYGDGSGADLSTKTIFKNLRDTGFSDLTVVVEVA